jgi:hypothetical protein
LTEPREQPLVIILADISGYTRFMLENQTSAVHGQQCITFLIETLLREVDIPLRLQEIEGDAVFLYAAREGDEAAWRAALAEVRAKLPRFFAAFLDGMRLAAEATPCGCAVCRDSGRLKLKLVVHSGHAVFHTTGGRALVSGADVILAHRLLKNSVGGDEYLLMTEPAYDDLGREMDGAFIPGDRALRRVRHREDLRAAHGATNGCASARRSTRCARTRSPRARGSMSRPVSSASTVRCCSSCSSRRGRSAGRGASGTRCCASSRCRRSSSSTSRSFQQRLKVRRRKSADSVK